MKRIDIQIGHTDTYTLIDCGGGRKLEQFGTYLLDRPDTQALWEKTVPEQWVHANASFEWNEKGERWRLGSETKDTWVMQYAGIGFSLSFKGFKHVGVFPEHSAQWDMIREIGKKQGGLKMLNLFGYTGGASIAGVQAGYSVTHVDASKNAIELVRENLVASNLPTDSIRLVCEDALRYVKRLKERGEVFDIVMMDPPAFGRGPKGEVWKIEESLHELLALIPSILSPEPKLVVLNGYAAGYSARTFGELLGGILPKKHITYGDIGIQQKDSEKILSTGIYAYFKAV